MTKNKVGRPRKDLKDRTRYEYIAIRESSYAKIKAHCVKNNIKIIDYIDSLIK
jgi:hypothetical protein